METKKLTPEMVAALKAPLPAEAISQHPTRKYLSSIKPAYVVERLNDVFGPEGWYAESRVVETGPMIVAETTLTVPEYGIIKSSFGGNDNDDRGDAYKGACTDGLTKCAFYLGVGMDVYKHAPTPAQAPPARKAQAAPAAPATKGPAPQPAPSSALAGDFLDVHISEVRHDVTKPSDRHPKGVPYCRVVDGRNSWPCFEPELFDALMGLQGERARLKTKPGKKGPVIVGIAGDADDSLGITDKDLPPELQEAS